MTEFDPSRSDAIRSLLVEAVEQTPRRDHRRHLRIAVIAVLAALGGGLGTAAVAVALTGGIALPEALGDAPAVTGSASPTPTPDASSTPTPAPAAPTEVPHPLVLSDDVIVPHDVLSAPPTTGTWSLTLPEWKQLCDQVSVIDVADGYALVQVGPTTPPEHIVADCDLSTVHMGLSLVDTTTGAEAWSRDWVWEPSSGWSRTTTVELLGTSGKILVSSGLPETSPQEVLDLVSGETLGEVDRSVEEWTGYEPLLPVGDSSSDVVWSEPDLDDDGQALGTWSVMRADPLTLEAPSWRYSIPADSVHAAPPSNGSSILQVTHRPVDGFQVLDVVDIDTGAVMVSETTDRTYTSYDGFTLRQSDFTDMGTPRTIAGIDWAGNEIWTRSDPSGFTLSLAEQNGGRPGRDLPLGSDLVLTDEGGRLELVDGLTGEARWVADGSDCAFAVASEPWARPTFFVDAGGALRQREDRTGCAFDLATGTPVASAAAVPDDSLWNASWSVSYALSGGLGTGGMWSPNWQDADPSVLGTATVYDALTGAELWTRPIAFDERWLFAGGRLVSVTGTTLTGLG